uniref:Uncharacterized protein n=1 Tax=Trachydiscus minutus TaxID=1032745 RepID=A0A0D3M5J8_9STRA|nr:putative protein Ycf19 [Trachydiscus minutus]AIB04130.1 putative protein Ycf19 [Trachydiscus minutus]
MESKLIFSDRYLLNDHLRLIYLTLSDKNKIRSSIQTAVQLKFANKKSLVRFYKALIRLNFINNLLNYNILFSYCLLKKYILTNLPWVLNISFSLPNLAFFLYHSLYLVKAIFSLKMLIDWFPIKNWERASPLKRFLRRATRSWTRPLEDYMPSILAWILILDNISKLFSFLKIFYITNDLANFPTSYNFEEIVEFVLESKLHTFGQKLI